MKQFLFLGAVGFLSLPVIVWAAPGEQAAREFVADLNRVILFPLIALLMGVAFLVFLLGCFQYIQGANNMQAREQGVKHITWGIIGLVIMISAWAILEIAAATFDLDDELRDASVTLIQIERTV